MESLGTEDTGAAGDGECGSGDEGHGVRTGTQFGSVGWVVGGLGNEGAGYLAMGIRKRGIRGVGSDSREVGLEEVK